MKRHDKKSFNSHKLWLELLNQKSTPSTSFSKPKPNNGANVETENSKSFYKTQEEYYDESIFLKKNVATLKGENEILKSKIRKDEDELTKKDKQLTEIINCIENQKGTQDSSVNNFIIIKKLRQNIFHLKSEIKNKENEIINIKSDVKYTKINELKVQNDAYLQEVKSLQQLISNVCSKEMSNEQPSSPVVTSLKPKSSKPAGKGNVTKKNKELLMENKTLKKELEKIDQVKYAMNDDINIISDRKKEDVILENERLKKACKEINQEKNELQMKYEELSSKYKLLTENLEKKEAEFNSLKRKSEQKPAQKSDSPIKTEKFSDHEKSQNQELIQSMCRSYINRERIIESISKETDDCEDLSRSGILRSAFIGYTLRQRSLNEIESISKETYDYEDLSRSDILRSAFIGYTLRQRSLNN